MFCVTVLRTAVTGPAGCAAWAQNLTPRGPIPLCYTILTYYIADPELHGQPNNREYFFRECKQ